MSDDWTKETNRLISELERRRDQLQRQLEGVQAKIKSLNGEIAGASSLLALHNNSDGNLADLADGIDSASDVPDVDKSKSVRMILREFAVANGGVLVVADAIRAMRTAGKFGNPDHAAPQTYSVLSRSNDYVQVSRGIYKLKPGIGETNP